MCTWITLQYLEVLRDVNDIAHIAQFFQALPQLTHLRLGFILQALGDFVHFCRCNSNCRNLADMHLDDTVFRLFHRIAQQFLKSSG